MRTPLKWLFSTVPVLVVGAVAWHLQHPAPVLSGAAGCAAAGVPAERAVGSGCEPLAPPGEDSQPGTRVTGIQLVQFEGEQIQWYLRAPSAYSEGEERVHVREPDLTLYGNDGQISTVTSAEGVVDSHAQSLLFTGHVVAKSATERLSTESLRFDPGPQTLSTDQKFLLVSQDMQLEGVGLILHQKSQRMVVDAQVQFYYLPVQEEGYREETVMQSKPS
ncbi:MAG: LPS export ABC transporter periplasmic protein LptC [Magnetococcales bacterium]|nr:LPS export ABC transporter periplasmic protein LptC [Magnetococcales bacterium]